MKNYADNIKASDEYILRQLHGKNYLLPIGQKIAAHCNSIELNESSLLLWNAIKSGVPRTELINILKDYYQNQSLNDDELLKDVNAFITQLLYSGALKDETKPSVNPNRYFRFASVTIGFTGYDKCLDPSLEDFSCDCASDSVTQHWLLRPLTYMPAFSGKLIINNRQLTLFLNEERYILMFPSNRHLLMCTISRDGSFAEFFYDHSLESDAKAELFYGMRNAFLVAAQNNGLFALHSASIEYNGKAWLFSGKSGTGKSTHTKLWNELYNTKLINGDINLIGIENNTVMTYGTPWCGTSGIYSTEKFPLGGIVILKQASFNKVEELSEDSRQLLVAQRMLSPTWLSSQTDRNLDFADVIQKHVNVCRLLCNTQPEAAKVMKDYIDSKTGACEMGEYYD